MNVPRMAFEQRDGVARCGVLRWSCLSWCREWTEAHRWLCGEDCHVPMTADGSVVWPGQTGMDQSGQTWELHRRQNLRGTSRMDPRVLASAKESMAVPELKTPGPGLRGKIMSLCLNLRCF